MHQQLPFSIEEYAERFGCVCRSVFRGETWDECEPSLRRSWEALSGILTVWKAQEMTWEEAQPFIHKAWV
jgi:hypothetical protein